MMTVIGYTLAVPDSVMGLTFIAAGEIWRNSLIPPRKNPRFPGVWIALTLTTGNSTFLGTSVPEAVSSIIVTRQGKTPEFPYKVFIPPGKGQGS